MLDDGRRVAAGAGAAGRKQLLHQLVVAVDSLVDEAVQTRTALEASRRLRIQVRCCLGVKEGR